MASCDNQSLISAVGPSSELSPGPKRSADANVSPHAIDQTTTIAVKAIIKSRM